MASEELLRQPGPQQLLSHTGTTPARGVGPDFGCSFGSEFACVEKHLDQTFSSKLPEDEAVGCSTAKGGLAEAVGTLDQPRGGV